MLTKKDVLDFSIQERALELQADEAFKVWMDSRDKVKALREEFKKEHRISNLRQTLHEWDEKQQLTLEERYGSIEIK